MVYELSSVVPLVLALLAAGTVAGFTAGLFGVGGGFVVVPALLAALPWLKGATEQHIYVAIGTSLATIIISSARSVEAHHRRRAVDFGVLKQWAPWLTLGVVAGLLVAARVEAHMLQLMFAIGVLVYSIYFLSPATFMRSGEPFGLPTRYNLAGLASGLGGFSALLGIGGGTPFVVTMVVCGRSVHQAVATAAGVGFIIAVPGTLGFLLLGMGEQNLPAGSVGYINVPALAAISLASVITAPMGARWAHSLNETTLKRVFGIYLLGVSSTMFYKTLLT